MTKWIIFPILENNSEDYLKYIKDKGMNLDTIFTLFDVILSDIYLGKFVLTNETHLELF